MFYVVITLLLYPIASHSFFMRALKRLYLARTKDPHLASFQPPKYTEKWEKIYQKEFEAEFGSLKKQNQGTSFKYQKPGAFEVGDPRGGSEVIKQRVKDEIGKHRQIKFSCGAIWIKMLCLRSDKQRKLYNIGKMKLEDDFNMVNLIKQVKNI